MIRPKQSGTQALSENVKVSPTLVFFLIHSMQVGIGILGFERYIVKDAGYDAWVSILIGGVIMHILLWMIYHILEDSDGDLVSVHNDIFGKFLGGLFSIIFSFYYLLLTLTVIRTFVEVVQVWIFPRLNVWVFTFLFLLLAYYFAAGGFRIVTGMCLFSVILGLPILALKFYPIQYAHLENLFPVIDHTLIEILAATKTVTLSYLGIELLLIYYPFIKKPVSSKKWAHHGVFFTTLLYLVTALVSFIYYSEKGIQSVIWPTISLWKIVELPFVERFEYVGIALWVYVILPNICLALWAASRIPRRVFHFRQRWVLILYFIILYIASGLLKDREMIDTLNDWTGKIGFYVLLYIPILFIIQKAMKKARKRHA
ncbi:GerAB/ArcD/ProY family transporter [Pseudalkalibacillus salsuginis]|uniref:GerAB/ArcD/ProY family transporter n=1 Tax=Pseudalkalibacillus salsuginis TaxID=2910972 RepID=UPI001F2FD414|nr:GerAB/ArcD/ProY family transporter [Pseudalkalibacillus salsuginis]MCF6410653.1 spore germination protein [Pseudalkalibacillus salsuginis]